MRSASRSGSLISLGVRCARCGFEGLRLKCWSEYGAAALLLQLLCLESSLAALRSQVLFLHPIRIIVGRGPAGKRSGAWSPSPRYRAGKSSRSFSICSLHLQATATASHLQLQSCVHVGGDPFLHVRSCSGRWTWMRSASRSGSLISLGARAAGSKVLGSNVGQNMAWLHCCCVCWVLSLESNRSLSDRV